MQTETSPVLSTQELAKELGVTRETIYRWRIIGYLPAPVRISENRVVWMRSTVDDWKASGQWADTRIARNAIRSKGKEYMDRMCRPEPARGKPESAEVARLLDEFEEKLARCNLLSGEYLDPTDAAKWREFKISLLRAEREQFQNEG